jgi:protein-disulfide isomerase
MSFDFLKNKRTFFIGLIIGISGTSVFFKTAPKIQENIQNRKVQEIIFTKNPIPLRNDPMLGREDAPITIVEFSDFQCPYCKMFHNDVFPQLKKDFIDKGIVRFVHKDLPLPFHKFGKTAAAASRCSNYLNLNYWDSYSNLYEAQSCIACFKPENIVLESKKFQQEQKMKECIDSQEITSLIENNIEEAMSENISGTPTFIIGNSSGADHRGEIVVGLRPYEFFKEKINLLLKEKTN